MKCSLFAILLLSFSTFAQNPVTGSFIAKLGDDTVIVETYNMLHNNLWGRAFLRYPQDQVGIFNIRFFPDGSIQHYSIAFMHPDSTYVSQGIQGVFCEADSCEWYASFQGMDMEYSNKHFAEHLDFIGGWTPTISLIEWNCKRLLRTNQQSLPVTLLNDYIGVRHIAVSRGENDTLIFGGPFIESTKILVSESGNIVYYDGTGTPWNYMVTRHPPLDVDAYARRMSKKPKIGIPSPEIVDTVAFGKDTIYLSYGRPSKRGRQIFGGVVKYDSVWRTGAGDPTKISLPFDIAFGKTRIPKGTYSLYTIPGRTEWTLIFNTDLKQWPTDPDRKKDFASVPMKVKILPATVETFKIDLMKAGKSGTISMKWDDTEAYTTFKILK